MFAADSLRWASAAIPVHESRERAGFIRGPDFFLVGAPKCGTTAMHEWLRQHPEVFVPERKESHRFGSDLDLGRVDGEGYLEMFREASGARAVGEASTLYLYSRRAAREIFEFNPEARILVMLRNPVDVMHAFHSERLWRGSEDIPDFAEALAAEPERRAGRRLPPHVRFREGLYYRQIASFSSQLERYFEVFGADRVHVIVHDDLARDAGAVFSDICRFLDVDPGYRPVFERVNANKVVRSRRLRDAMTNRHSPLRALARTVPLGPRRRADAWLRRVNTRVDRRQPMNRELRRKLMLEFRPEVARLSEVLGRDLTHWCRTD